MINLSKIPTHIGYYIAGFLDITSQVSAMAKEVLIVPFANATIIPFHWKVSLCFNVSQKDKVILTLLKKHLQCGTMRSRADGVWYFEVNNLEAIRDNVIPFFRKFGFLSSKKQNDFRRFQEIHRMIEDDAHLTIVGIMKILTIRNQMNDGGKRTYTDEEIIEELRKSSETTRQALIKHQG